MNQQQQFVDPIGGGEAVDFKEHVNQLVLIEPIKIEHNITTDNGVTDAVVADVTFIDAPTGLEVHERTYIFTTAIKGKVEEHIGSKVLGRVIPATSKANRPYPDLAPASDQDKQLAGQYVAQREQQRQASQFQGPAQPQGQPQAPRPPEQAQSAPQGWPQQQPPAQPQAPAPQQPPAGWPQPQQSQPPF